MGAVSSIFATVQEAPAPSLPAQTDATFSPQANAPPTTGAAQQDIVTLAGRAAEGQQTRAGSDNGQFGEAAAFFFAEKQSFRAGTGSAGSQTAQAPSVPQLPVKIVQEPAVVQNASAARGQANTTNTANASAAGAGADPSATQQASPSSGATGAANTPLAQLAQLDDTLQQMGVNPQSISLFNRMAMVLYANDPAALRVLVQTLQSGAQQLTENNSSDGANGTNTNEPQTATAASPSSSQQLHLPAATVSGNGAENQVEPVAEQSDADPGTGQTRQAEPPATYRGANATTDGSTMTTGAVGASQEAQPSQLSIQVEELNLAFAAIGAQPSSLAASSAKGQLLNVTF